MKLNVSYPATGAQKLIEIEDERKLRVFMEKRVGAVLRRDGLDSCSLTFDVPTDGC